MTIHCHHCNQSLPIGQAYLSEAEIDKLPMTEGWDVIRWQCVKGAAVYYSVSDWTHSVDRTLTYEENIQLMQIHGEDPNYDTRR